MHPVPGLVCGLATAALLAPRPNPMLGGGPRGNGVSYDAPAWSPDDRRIASVRSSGGLRPRIVIADADGTQPAPHSAGPLSVPGAVRHFHFDGSSSFYSLKWSPDGTRLAFVERRSIIAASAEFSDRICLLSADGRHFRGLELPVGDIGTVASSPDGKRLAVAANRNVFLPGYDKERRADLYVVDAASGHARKLAPCPGDVRFLLVSRRPVPGLRRAPALGTR